MVLESQQSNPEASVTGARACRSLLLGWTDEQTGERLEVSVRASDEFLRSLSEQGFEVLDESGPHGLDAAHRHVEGIAVARASRSVAPRAARLTDRPQRLGA